MGINPTGTQLARLMEQVSCDRKFAFVSCQPEICMILCANVPAQLRSGQAEEGALIPLDRFELVSNGEVY